MGMTTLIVMVAVGAALYFLSRKYAAQPEQPAIRPAELPQTADGDTAELYRVADQIEGFFKKSAHPSDLPDNDHFQRGVQILSSENYTEDDLLSYYGGDNTIISCMALVALGMRSCGPEVVDKIIYYLGSCGTWSLYFAFEVIARLAGKPLIGAVLLQAPSWWIDNRLLMTILRDFVDKCSRRNEHPTFGQDLAAVSQEQINYISALIEKLGLDVLQPLSREIRQTLSTRIDRRFLNSVGHLWTKTNAAESVHLNAQRKACLQQIERTLTGGGGRSIILVGEAGVGKTTLVKLLADRLGEGGMTVFEAGATELIAGQSFIGDLEERLRDLVKNLDRRRRVVWFVPNIHELRYAGRHRYSTVGILDMLMPYIDSGAITLIGETRPTPFAQLKRDIPRIKATFEIIAIEPLDQAETLAIARRWANHCAVDHLEDPLIPEAVLLEAAQLAQQFVSDDAAPGNLIDLLKLTCQGLFHGTCPTRRIEVDDIYQTLSQLTGLPRTILDERRGLDIEALRAHFVQRVKGQAEAVDCLVERIALIKAGLTDPSRPLGVFLFAGPTGTGKTEIAKTLAEFLFGSPERMIRLDMSEFKTATAEGRILGDPEEGRSARAMVNQIRRQPFSVVLLDEFEKAHPNIWDLFLQVFDDGRLTDRQGNTADFRHAIIILTSNLGATIQPGAGIGFNPRTAAFSLGQVQKAIGKTFRPEFINRLDRVVVFKPLSREVMREILYNELNDVLQRRGLRNREWAVEWEASAIDFLLDTGFTADLGARPLKRAIEQHLLAPLAMTIVNHQHPEGDQFLFVRAASNRIEVEFIDPDAPFTESPEVEPSISEEASPDHTALKALILAPHGSPDEVESLGATLQRLAAAAHSEEWQTQKRHGLKQMTVDGFWQQADCSAVLGRIETMDRIEAGLKTATSLWQRLRGRGDQPRAAYSRKIIVRLAEQLYLLDEALQCFLQHLPQEAFLLMETAVVSLSGSPEDRERFARDLRRMYLGWASRRRMRTEVLADFSSSSVDGNRFLLAISGYGAYAILRPESGLHVLETPKDSKTYERISIRVRVVDQPDAAAHGIDELRRQAEEKFNGETDVNGTVVRRYRSDPSPLVRDAVRQYRTGLLNRVLAGDFDLFG